MTIIEHVAGAALKEAVHSHLSTGWTAPAQKRH